MNSQTIFKRMRWNILIAIVIVITIAMLAVGGGYAGMLTIPLLIADYGDLPGSYTDLTLYGLHQPTNPDDPNPLRLGSIIDFEETGILSDFASGDDDDPVEGPDDEDGVERNMNELWTIGNTVHLTVTVDGCTSEPCYLNGWIDWGGGGTRLVF